MLGSYWSFLRLLDDDARAGGEKGERAFANF